jgi:hypothetical protein
MVTEVLVWAMIMTNNHNRIVEVYNNELLCRQDAREVRRALPEAEVKCVPRYAPNHPGWNSSGRAP